MENAHLSVQVSIIKIQFLLPAESSNVFTGKKKVWIVPTESLSLSPSLFER